MTRMRGLHRVTCCICVLPRQRCSYILFNLVWWRVTGKLHSVQRSFVPCISIPMKTGTTYGIPLRLTMLHDSPIQPSTVDTNIAAVCIVGEGAEMPCLTRSTIGWLSSVTTGLHQNQERKHMKLGVWVQQSNFPWPEHKKKFKKSASSLFNRFLKRCPDRPPSIQHNSRGAIHFCLRTKYVNYEWLWNSAPNLFWIYTDENNHGITFTDEPVVQQRTVYSSEGCSFRNQHQQQSDYRYDNFKSFVVN